MENNLASTHRRTRLLAAGIASALMAYGATAAAVEHVKTLVSFTGPPDVFLPSAGMVLGPDGNFYGTSFYGGEAGLGTVNDIGHDSAQDGPKPEPVPAHPRGDDKTARPTPTVDNG